LAHEGRVAPKTLKVLGRARKAGKKLILITGRTLDDLRTVFSEISLFDLIVAENGAILLDPTTGAEESLCPAVPASFLTQLSERSVPFSVGKCVIATCRPHEIVIEQVTARLNLQLAVSLNRESVMVLPRGIDKASGLKAAVQRLKIPLSEVVGIGDAENDIPFLNLCGFSAAVANAIDALKQQVDQVTEGSDGAGASEIVEQVIAGELLVKIRD
jgi:hypothetical protein